MLMLFEFNLAPGAEDEYADVSARMRALVDNVSGFGGIERFESCSEPGRFIAIASFRDEDSIETWRTQSEHRRAQAAGRDRLFSNYRLRIAEVVRDYSRESHDQAPADSREHFDGGAHVRHRD